MALNLKSFTTLIEDQVAAMQSSANRLLDFTKGAVLRAAVEANASVAIWLESLILHVLTLTRAATSSGADLDSWVGDFGLVRLTSQPSAGAVTFSRYTTTPVGYVPVGVRVRTGDGLQQFVVVADASNPNYREGEGRYFLPPHYASLTVPVRAVTPGVGSNVAAGEISLIVDSVVGFDTVNNAVAMTGGTDAETDGALRKRFVAFLASLSKATLGAIGYGIASLQIGADYQIIENERLDGTSDNGLLTVVVDDGTGYASAAFVQNCQAAVNLTRAAGIRAGAFAATAHLVNIAITIEVDPLYEVAQVTGAVSAALVNYVNALPIGATVLRAAIIAKAYSTPGVANVTAATINGAEDDLVSTRRQKPRCQNVAVAGG